MSTYFDESSNQISTGALVRSAHINTLRDNVGAGFDQLPEPTEIKQNTSNVGIESGVANAYILTMPYTMSSYTMGHEIVLIPGTTNTGASVVDVDGLGAKAIKRPDGTDLEAGDLEAGYIYVLRYNGTTYQFTGAAPKSFLVGSDASAAAAAASAAEAYSSQVLAFNYAEASAVSSAEANRNYVKKDHTDSPYTASVYHESIWADITGGNLTINLPASPSNNNRIAITKIGLVSSGYTLTLGRNGKTIMGEAEDLIIDIDYISVDLVYKEDDGDWRIAQA